MIMKKVYPIRILQVVGGMNRGGIETWLMHVLRHIDRDRFQIDFLVHTNEPCAYDHEIRLLGSQIIPCRQPNHPWVYSTNFQQILKKYGSYDIVHSHVHHFSGFVLRLARQAGVPIRIAHSHNDTSSIEVHTTLYRRLYLALMRRWIDRHATVGLAASRLAAANLFGQTWENDLRWQTFYCGVDLTPFQTLVDSENLRAEFGIPSDALVIGHVGRFEAQKNHEFLIQVAAEMAKQESKVRLFLIGEGLLRSEIQQKVTQMGIRDHVLFVGSRADVPHLMLGVMNGFLLPSLYEGLGLVLVEAQAAGLPCICSDVVPAEADIVKPLVQRMSLSQSAVVWAETILAIARNPILRFIQKDSLCIVEKSVFNIEKSIKKLTEVYETNFAQY
jgi:glycosyltransferase involved in cell wall biosynthesis